MDYGQPMWSGNRQSTMRISISILTHLAAGRAFLKLVTGAQELVRDLRGGDPPPPTPAAGTGHHASRCQAPPPPRKETALGTGTDTDCATWTWRSCWHPRFQVVYRYWNQSRHSARALCLHPHGVQLLAKLPAA
jgi:hypothetical protein